MPRYHFNTNTLLAGVRARVKWADVNDVKAEIERQVTALLGPKTDADLAQRPDKKKAKVCIFWAREEEREREGGGMCTKDMQAERITGRGILCQVTQANLFDCGGLHNVHIEKGILWSVTPCCLQLCVYIYASLCTCV
jgi:hypothetical protein